MRSYNILDMIRVQRLASENPHLGRMGVVKLYNERYPELSAKEKYLNLVKAVKSI
jgi:hypothetical protein